MAVVTGGDVGDVGTGSPPVTLWGIGDGIGVAVSARAMVPESVPRIMASTSPRVNVLCIGSLLYGARCAARRLGILREKTDDLVRPVAYQTQQEPSVAVWPVF